MRYRPYNRGYNWIDYDNMLTLCNIYVMSEKFYDNAAERLEGELKTTQERLREMVDAQTSEPELAYDETTEKIIQMDSMVVMLLKALIRHVRAENK